MDLTPKPLRTLQQADLTNEVVHFTGRQGMANDRIDPEIQKLNSAARLARILETRTMNAYQVFHGYFGDPVVCFTEATEAGLAKLVDVNRYHAWGLGFTKSWVFQQGGGPALYIRGDMWDEFQVNDAISKRLKAFGTKYWPGVVDDTPAPQSEGQPKKLSVCVSSTLTKPNEWAHEREWRIPRIEEAPTVSFDYADVAALVAPSREGLDYLKGLASGGALNHVREVILVSSIVKWKANA